MSTVDDLRAEQNNKADEISENENGINNMNDRLDRLFDAQRSVGDLKDYAGQMRTDVNSSVDGWNGWQGSSCGRSRGYIQGDLNDGYNYYISDIDAAQDAICDAIRDLENQKNDAWGIIGNIQDVINDVADEIWKILN